MPVLIYTRLAEFLAGDTPVKFPLVDVMPLIRKDELNIILINRTPDKPSTINLIFH